MPGINSLTDIELVNLIKSGNRAAFAEIYERYWTVLFLHARNLLRQNEEAADLVQEVFTALWLKSQSLELSASVSAYLYKAIRNKVFDHLRHKKVMNDYLKSINDFMLEENFTSDHLLREKELASIIENEINSLPPKMRDVFVLSRKQYLSYEQIALHLNISEHTVKSQISNALRILRTKVGASSFLIIYLLHH
ncbi:RNA polymerase sigma-70 factor [Pedobacter nototheniae]|uniref:RNA polymerase sigma factor n=1 Tax=Pedobacter nototheniae TaxID=2488994 RepID=UPI00292CCF82|nr:RNA polymerase sigma-70 factor [Pedobacter nototheniae]